jgi:hypothetical protein
LDDRLALSITHSDGHTTRWGPDEPNAQDIPGDTTFGTQMPGLFKDLSCPLLRRIDVDYSDLGLYDSVRVYGPGNRTAWEGRMAQFPRSHGDSFEIVPGAVGWSAALNDKPTFTEPYVDRDPGSFSEWPLDRRLALAAANISMGDLSWSQDAGGLNVALPNQALGTQTMTEAWALYPPGRKVTKIMYQAASTSLPAGWVVADAHGGQHAADAGADYRAPLHRAGRLVRRYGGDTGGGRVGAVLEDRGVRQSRPDDPR